MGIINNKQTNKKIGDLLFAEETLKVFYLTEAMFISFQKTFFNTCSAFIFKCNFHGHNKTDIFLLKSGNETFQGNCPI